MRKYVLSHLGAARWLKKLRSRNDFDKPFYALVARFPSSVRVGRAGSRPTFGHKAKIVSLYFKALLTEREPVKLAVARKVGKWFHIPLDNIVLKRVHEHFGKELKMKRRLRLKTLRKPKYVSILQLLRKKARKVGVPPIWYDDFWAMRGQERA